MSFVEYRRQKKIQIKFNHSLSTDTFWKSILPSVVYLAQTSNLWFPEGLNLGAYT